MKTQPIYRTAELAKMLHLSHKATISLMKRLGVPRTGQSCYLYLLADIKTYAPSLFSSLLEASSINGVLELEQVDEEASLAQFKY